MSWSAVVALYTVTFVMSAVVFGVVFLLALDPRLYRRLQRQILRQPYYPEMVESRLYDEALRLRATVEAALRSAPISDGQRRELKEQVSQVPSRVATTLARLHRLREVKKDLYATPLAEAYQAQKQELAALECELLGELRCSLEALGSVPVSLLTVEMRRDERRLKQVVEEVADSNNRMRDLAAAWKELG